MSYAEMMKQWPNGFRHDPDAMEKVRAHGRREHTLPHMGCPVCIRFWPSSAAKRHHEDDLIASVRKRSAS